MFAPTRNLLLLVVSLLLVSCGGSDVAVTEMKKELSDLKGAIEKLGQDIEGLKQDRAAFIEEWTSSKERLKSMQKEVTGLKKQARRKKGPKIVVVKEDFFTGMINDDVKAIKVNGVVKNVGDQAASNVIVGVTCQGCSEEAQPNTWFTALDSNKVKIDSVPAGQTAEFEVQFARIQGSPRTVRDKDPPEGIGVKVISFGRVE
jgi:outer membrane murein-binding lipoprotein Lpp